MNKGMKSKLSEIRNDYRKAALSEEVSPNEPFQLLESWIHQAIECELSEPTAMVLSTVNLSGMPSSRLVLLKGLEQGILKFFTNYESAKAAQMEKNSGIALLFFWAGLERQVRIEGKAFKLPSEESDQYFKSRPRESQLGAWSSRQSRVIASRDILQKEFEKQQALWEDKIPERPSFWGGYGVKPHYIEFWQGRSSRLHDRLAYTLINSDWIRQRLSP